MTEIDIVKYLDDKFLAVNARLADIKDDISSNQKTTDRQIERLWKHNTLQDDKIADLGKKIAYVFGATTTLIIIINLIKVFV